MRLQKMSIFINDGAHVTEKIYSSFKLLVNSFASVNNNVRFSLNVQDKVNVDFSCDYSSASEYIKFLDALNKELKKNDIAIVIENDYRKNTSETTIFVVCNDQ